MSKQIEELRIGKYKYNGCKESAIADPYSVSKAYSKGDLVMNNGYLYSALSDMEAGEWDAAKWLKTNVVNEHRTIADINDWVDISSSMLWRNGYQPVYTPEYSTLNAYYSPSMKIVKLSGHRGVVVSTKTWGVGQHQIALDFEYTDFYGFHDAPSAAEIPSPYRAPGSFGEMIGMGRGSDGASNMILGVYTFIGPASGDDNNGIAFKPVTGDATTGSSNNNGFVLNGLYLKVTPRGL